MDLPLILLIIGLITTIVSFFFGNSSRKYEDELEKMSISLHQETNSLNKRVKMVEEELMIGMGPSSSGRPTVSQATTTTTKKPIHEIIVNQILSLHAQDYSIGEIANRSSLSHDDVIAVLRSRGMLP